MSPSKTPLLLVSTMWIIGCTGPEPERPAVLSTRLGPHLEALWNAHGGYDRWRALGGVVFDVTFEFDDGQTVEESLAFCFDDFRTIWRREPVSPPVDPSSTETGRWRAVPVGEATARPVPATWRSGFESVADPTSDALDFARLSLRNLLPLVFEMVQPRWTLRAVVSPRNLAPRLTTRLDEEIHVLPREAPNQLGPYLLTCPGPTAAPASGTHFLDHITYASCHPAYPRGVFEAVLSDFTCVQGIWIATRREHYQRVPAPEVPLLDPLELAPPDATAAPRPVLRDTLREIRFLTREEMGEITGRKREP